MSVNCKKSRMRKQVFVYAVVNASRFDELLPGQDRKSFRFSTDKSKFIFKTFTEDNRLVGVPLYSKENIKRVLSLPQWKPTSTEKPKL